MLQRKWKVFSPQSRVRLRSVEVVDDRIGDRRGFVETRISSSDGASAQPWFVVAGPGGLPLIVDDQVPDVATLVATCVEAGWIGLAAGLVGCAVPHVYALACPLRHGETRYRNRALVGRSDERFRRKALHRAGSRCWATVATAELPGPAKWGDRRPRTRAFRRSRPCQSH